MSRHDEAIEPCPFFGSANIYVLTDCVYCKHCGIRTMQVFNSAAEAAAAWNRRTPPASGGRDAEEHGFCPHGKQCHPADPHCIFPKCQRALIKQGAAVAAEQADDPGDAPPEDHPNVTPIRTKPGHVPVNLPFERPPQSADDPGFGPLPHPSADNNAKQTEAPDTRGKANTPSPNPWREMAAQLAFDQQSDDPQPGDWNDACEHIAKLIRALKPLPLPPAG